MSLSEHENLQVIFNRLQAYLLRDHTFTRQGLNRSNLATLIRTNEKYLVKAIRFYANGKSVSDYLNGLRMDYVCSLLKTYPDYTIDAISMESGITSRSAFYRIFKKHVGCSPSEYRVKIGQIPNNGIMNSQ